jgi:hypothetical protein
MTCPDVRRERGREVAHWQNRVTHARLPVRAQTEISRERALLLLALPSHTTHMGGGEGDVEKEESVDGGNLQAGSPLPRPDLSTRPWSLARGEGSFRHSG